MRFTSLLIARGRHLVTLCLLALLLVAAFSHQSQAQEREYRLGVKDVINVSVYAGGEKQLDADLTIHADGKVTVPLLGPVQAAGLMVGDLIDAINAPLARDYFVNPQVTVTIKEYHSLSFYVSGSVVNPGHYELSAEPTILELLAKAGGLKPGYGRSAYVLREAGGGDATGEKAQSLTVDLMKLFDQGALAENLSLKSGDVVHIPMAAEQNQAASNIFVEGEVIKPGVYSYQPGLSALNACILAGGFTKYAAPNRARIIRKKESGQEVIHIDLDGVKKGAIPDVLLQPGDLVHVPETWL